MRIKFSPANLKKAKWYEMVIRFILGGFVTALISLVAKAHGPSLGGLFLAFPSIFPAATTLVERHERGSGRPGHDCKRRGEKAAALDAAGSVIGSLGLLVFALIVWRLLPTWKVAITLSLATCGWFIFAVLIWWILKDLLKSWRHRLKQTSSRPIPP